MVTTVEHIKPNGKYTVLQAAKAMGVSRSTIYNWAKSGAILFKLGRTKRRQTITGSQLISLRSMVKRSPQLFIPVPIKFLSLV